MLGGGGGGCGRPNYFLQRAFWRGKGGGGEKQQILGKYGEKGFQELKLRAKFW